MQVVLAGYTAILFSFGLPVCNARPIYIYIYIYISYYNKDRPIFCSQFSDARFD